MICMQVMAKDLEPGALVDLEGDEYATMPRPEADARELADHESTVSTFAYEYAEVETVERETDECVVVYTGLHNFACPPDHWLKVVS